MVLINAQTKNEMPINILAKDLTMLISRIE